MLRVYAKRGRGAANPLRAKTVGLSYNADEENVREEKRGVDKQISIDQILALLSILFKGVPEK
jgi:hypothetical protein